MLHTVKSTLNLTQFADTFAITLLWPMKNYIHIRKVQLKHFIFIIIKDKSDKSYSIHNQLSILHNKIYVHCWFQA